MADRFDLTVAREGSDGKTYWTNIGKAFPNRSGGGYTLVLNALPLTNKDGECRVMMFPEKDREDRVGSKMAQQHKFNNRARGDLDDDIPF